MTCVHPPLSSNTEPTYISMSAHELASKPTVAFPVRPGSMGSSHASTRPGNSLPLYTMVGPHPGRSGLATGRAVSGSIFTAALILNSTKLISDLRSIQLDQKLTFLALFHRGSAGVYACGHLGSRSVAALSCQLQWHLRVIWTVPQEHWGLAAPRHVGLVGIASNLGGRLPPELH